MFTLEVVTKAGLTVQCSKGDNKGTYTKTL